MRSICSAAALLMASAAMQSANAETSDSVKIPARFECSALIPKRMNNSAFVSQMAVSYSRGQLSADRQLLVGDGAEQFTGKIDPLGRIEMTGTYDNKQSWIIRLKGQLDDKGPTVLRGDLEVTSGSVGHRNCSLTFLPKPNELLAAFSR